MLPKLPTKSTDTASSDANAKANKKSTANSDFKTPAKKQQAAKNPYKKKNSQTATNLISTSSTKEGNTTIGKVHDFVNKLKRDATVRGRDSAMKCFHKFVDAKKIDILADMNDAEDDEAKGEALVLLSTEEMGDESVKSLRQKLLDLGVAALWIPKKIIKVDSIPSLASGKLDIKGCEDLAKNH